MRRRQSSCNYGARQGSVASVVESVGDTVSGSLQRVMPAFERRWRPRLVRCQLDLITDAGLSLRVSLRLVLDDLGDDAHPGDPARGMASRSPSAWSSSAARLGSWGPPRSLLGRASLQQVEGDQHRHPNDVGECQKPGALRRELDRLMAKPSVQHCGPDLKHAVSAAGRPAHLSALVHAGTHQLVDCTLGP